MPGGSSGTRSDGGARAIHPAPEWDTSQPERAGQALIAFRLHISPVFLRIGIRSRYGGRGNNSPGNHNACNASGPHRSQTEIVMLAIKRTPVYLRPYPRESGTLHLKSRGEMIVFSAQCEILLERKRVWTQTYCPAPSPQAMDTLLRARLDSIGGQLLFMSTPEAVGIEALKFNPEHTAINGIWIDVLDRADGATTLAGHWLGFEDEHLSVSPLDSQFGVYPTRSIPPELSEALSCEPLHLYGLICARKVDNLDLRLSRGSTPALCLYEGEQREKFAKSAPWLVALAEDDAFTRSLFTDAPDKPSFTSLWRKDPVVILRSSLEIGDLARHLKRFVRLQDDSGDWHYLRYWESDAFSAFVDWLHCNPSFLRKFLTTSNGEDQTIDKIAIPDSNRSSCRVITYPRTAPSAQAATPIIDSNLKARLAQVNRVRSFRTCCDYLHKVLHRRTPERSGLDAISENYMRAAWVESYGLGMTSELGRCRLAVAMTRLGHRFLDDPKYMSVGLSRHALKHDTTGETLFDTLKEIEPVLFNLDRVRMREMIDDGAFASFAALEHWLRHNDGRAMNLWGDSFDDIVRATLNASVEEPSTISAFFAYVYGAGYMSDPLLEPEFLQDLQRV